MEINFCSYCGAEWEPGSEQCQKCGRVLRRFRPRPDYDGFSRAGEVYCVEAAEPFRMEQ